MAKNAPAQAPAAPLFDGTFTVGGESVKYIWAPMDQEIPRSKSMPFLMGRDGKLYTEKSLVPAGAKKFRVTITVVE